MVLLCSLLLPLLLLLPRMQPPLHRSAAALVTWRLQDGRRSTPAAADS
jgi:hypothetical protein